MKRNLSMLMIFVLLISNIIPVINVSAKLASDGYDYVLFNYSSFAGAPGTWIAESTADSYCGYVRRGLTTSVTQAEDAIALFQVETDGTYYVWARTRDYDSNQGVRKFNVGINNGVLKEYAGDSGINGWEWELLGGAYLKKGETNKLRLIDTSRYYARCDAIVVTNNPSFSKPAKDQIKTQLGSYLCTGNGTYTDKWNGDKYYYNSQAVDDFGSWSTQSPPSLSNENNRAPFSKIILKGETGKNYSDNEPAVIKAHIINSGTYTLWQRNGSRYPTSQFSIEVNGVESRVLGSRPDVGYAWEKVGEFFLKQGENIINIHDKNSYHSYVDCLLFTKDGTCQPPDFYEQAVSGENVYYNSTTKNVAAATFPEYAVQEVTPSSTVQISNDNVTVKFHNVETANHTFVQNEVYYKGDKLKSATDSYGRMFFNYDKATNVSHTRGSPTLSIDFTKPFNTVKGDWITDTSWGLSSEKVWTNFAKANLFSQTVGDFNGETITVKLNIPKAGYYYGVTRGSAYDNSSKRGYTAAIDGKILTTSNATHYFNVTNNNKFGSNFAFSYNTDPVYLNAGIVTVNLTSSGNSTAGGSPMRTSMFALIPASSTSELDAMIAKFTNYEMTISILGGTALDNYTPSDNNVPITTTGYPYPICYDYIASIRNTRGSIKTDDLYMMGDMNWIVPKKAVQTSANSVTVTFENEFATLTEEWSLQNGDEEPRISMTIKAKKRGSYSVAIPSHDNYSENEYDYAFLPMQYRGHGIPETALLTTEQYMFTPMVSVSLPKENSVVSGKSITYGFAVEPSWIPLRWVYNDNYKFGATLRMPSVSASGSVAPVLVAPAQGSEDCLMNNGDTYNFKYRPIYRTDDWYSSFDHVLSDIYEFRDYRENYYNSVTDAILNTTEVMMDDDYGGWDDNVMGHWNMEGRTITSSASPLEAVQRFMLTDDVEILRERTIPTIINALTRNSHFKSDTLSGGSQTGYVGSSSSWPTKIKGPSSTYGAGVYGGFDAMSGGALPYARELAELKVSDIKSTSDDPKNISDLVSMYKYTQDSKYLELATQIADNYLKVMKQDIYKKTPVDFSSFAYISYMPNIAALMDIYDVTKEQRFLDAAEYAGQVVLSLIWTVGIDGTRTSENMTITKDYLSERNFMPNHNFWWHGEEQWRPGTNDGDPGECSVSVHPMLQAGFNDLKDETVPAWVPSRVGIGLEQPSTFYRESLDMIMSNWAGDMMRLAEYTDNDLFEAAARNAIVGRFGTYSGYYVNRFVTYQMKENYLKETPVDFTGVYWHHIPPFLSMIEDFIVSQAWNWSNKKIDFPFVRQRGYAYFNNNQYGYEPGRFFDEENMWLWIDEGIVETNNNNADWIAARKDGVLGVAFMNAKNSEITVKATLGEKADSDYSGTVYLYKADGSVTSTTATKGVFNVTLPAHGLVAALIYTDDVSAPSYANVTYENLSSDKGTMVQHTDVTGSGMILQLTPDRYFAHVYVTDTPDVVSKIVVKYTFGNDSTVHTATDNQYPYECIIEATDVSKNINYTVETYNTSGTLINTSKKYTMTPLEHEKHEIAETDANLLITGSNVKPLLKGDYNYQSVSGNGYKFILDSYSLFSSMKQITEKPVLTVNIPESGEYYIYANMRSGHSTQHNSRVMTLNITQDGKEVPITDKTSDVYKFGYSDDCVTLGAQAESNDFFYGGMGFRTPNKISLKKGVAEIKFNFTTHAGFDFVLLTKESKTISQMEECCAIPGYNIYKFDSGNTKLKEFLTSMVDVTAPSAPVILKSNVKSDSGINIEISDAEEDNVNYGIYVNGVKSATVSKVDVLKNNGVYNVKNVAIGDKVTCTVIDSNGNESAHSKYVNVTTIDCPRPKTFANLKSGTDYTSVSQAQTAGVLPDGFFLFMTQKNFDVDKSVATKTDTNLFTGVKENLYTNYATQFQKAYSASFVIPDNGADTSYQFISSYLRAHNGNDNGILTDSRRTHFLLIDGKAVTTNGLVEWNGKTSYNGTDNYGTNSYVFGSEYPHEFATAAKPNDLMQNYPHTIVDYTGHLWGYSPAIVLEPGLHTVEVYAVGGSSWFNDLIITDDIGYDITKLLYGGLTTRGTGWKNNYSNVITPLYTDYSAPSFGNNATVYRTAGGEYGVINWTEPGDNTLHSIGKNLYYEITIKDSDGNVIETGHSMINKYIPKKIVSHGVYTVSVKAYDSVGNESNLLTGTYTTSTNRPEVFANLGSGTEYGSVIAAKEDEALPDDFTIFMTQNNFKKESTTTKVDTNLFTGIKENYYSVSSTNFVKAYTGTFVIPVSNTNENYRFISSYLRAVNYGTGSAPHTDNRRTQFILIDGKALTANGLVEWNGKTSYDGTDNYGTNAYVFGYEYPHEFTTAADPQNSALLQKNYPHNKVAATSHLWGYSPIVELEPGIHTVEVYSVGGSSWFNDLIVTKAVNYDITKLLFGGLGTRGTGWVNNYNNVIKPMYTDYSAPTFASNAEITIGIGGRCGLIRWTDAEDEGLGATGKNVYYSVEIKDAGGKVIETGQSPTNSYLPKKLTAGITYQVSVKAVDSTGNTSKVITGSIIAKQPSLVFEYGDGESTITFYPENDEKLLGEKRIFVVGYDNLTGKYETADIYDITVNTGSENTLEITTRNDTEYMEYVIFIWEKSSMKPVVQSFKFK